MMGLEKEFPSDFLNESRLAIYNPVFTLDFRMFSKILNIVVILRNTKNYEFHKTAHNLGIILCDVI
jgi:hypothetical protein